MSERRRVFFALWPEPGEAEPLAQALRARPAALTGRMLDPRDWHLTLRFLGSLDAAALAALQGAAAAVRGARFELQLDRLEHWTHARTLVLTSARPSPAAALGLARSLEDLARAAGLAPEERPLRPHVTLARGVSAWSGETGALALHLTASAFHLAESLAVGAEPAGVRYRRLASWPLGATPD